MNKTRPLSVAMTVLIVALAVGGTVELARTTLAGESVAAAAAVVGFLVAALAVAVAAGARSREWLSNPDSYW